MEGGERSAVGREHLPVAPAGHQLVFREVSQDLDDRPFARPRPAAERLVRDSLDQATEGGSGLALHRERVAARGEGKQAGAIGIELAHAGEGDTTPLSGAVPAAESAWPAPPEQRWPRLRTGRS